ncbi:glycosyltransferase family 4 protein [Vibrio europaeus]|uniref:Glycosyltransferase family 4 protein n=1 Tax=Vibrio europaeus TaxID=300876 RepID=A0AAE7AW77_9VIBR|nr:glycosyltransferase family 4 protein [Vibrio europaeus]MDC5806776.1 glycosyltransferase family 4 protein [Vibrio europaeus]MDC5810087.1 glycosyltransferase family 4 protein [Vibrio europaeus]MDC5821729.1 glycosyltransferase family 4 protein [Vibrio europaeus]MDC5827301.1 glycosyltransferase family 4 protein [Vibrio europaeus]MDC5830145.1 glycosyltransferase family 4 protein [Vibrio europaeus]
MSNNSSNEVWLVIDSLTFGGIETHVLELAKGLRQFQVPVTVLFLCSYPQRQLLEEKLEANRIPTKHLDSDGNHYLSTLLHLVRTHKPALLHAHGYKASITTKLIRLLTGVRQISTYHAGETPSGKVWLYDFIDRFTSFVSNHSIAVSDKIARKLVSRTVCFNNFIDTRETQRSKGKQIAFVGRLSHEKGPDRFIKLAKANRQLKFDFYGSGVLEDELKQLASDNVHFHGHQNNMNAIWPSVGVLVICSRFEGLPMTALESMARGIPVFSLNVGNMPSLINHQTNGYLVNDMDELGLALTTFLSQDEKHTAQLKQQAVETVEQSYSQSAVIPQILELYFSNAC